MISSSIKNVRGLSSFATIPPTNMKPNQPLFQHQRTLPKLPIPSLTDTLDKYLQTARPLLNDHEFQRTEALVKEFGRGIGQVLHERLLNKAKSLTPNQPSSWLYEWWNNYAYMSYRDPVVLNVNYFFQFVDTAMSQVHTASQLIQAALAFQRLVTTQQLPPETANKLPLCSVQYNYLFSSCRVPAPKIDLTATYDPNLCNHIVIIHQNRFFKLNVLDSNRVPLSTDMIARAINGILGSGAAHSDNVPIGVLTTENRDVWTDARDKLIAIDPSNAQILESIQSSIFVLCLDDSAPVTREEVGRALWHGDGKNRWFDKHVQFVVFANGKAGFNGEHSMMDATPTGRMCEWMLNTLIHNKITHTTTNMLPAQPELLQFKTNHEIQTLVTEAERKFNKQVQAHDLQVLYFPGYGKGYIKTQRMSPDGYVQLAIQLAYYKMYHKFVGTYESAQTRKFQYGRTEVGRTVSNESCAFVKAMVGMKSVAEAAKVAELLNAAVLYHGKYMRECSAGKGIDRHLLGLKLSLQENEPVPSLFNDPGYLKTCHWKLSTSQLTSELFDGYGWGQVVDDGYGCAYMIKEMSIHINIVSKHLDNAKFRHFLTESLVEMRQVLDAASATGGDTGGRSKL